MTSAFAIILTDTLTRDTLLLPADYNPEAVYEWVEGSDYWGLCVEAGGEGFEARVLDVLERLYDLRPDDYDDVLTLLGLDLSFVPQDPLISEALADAVRESRYAPGLYVEGDSLCLSLTGDPMGVLSIDPDGCGWVLEGELVPYDEPESLVAEIEDLWLQTSGAYQEDVLSTVVARAVSCPEVRARLSEGEAVLVDIGTPETLGDLSRQVIALRSMDCTDLDSRLITVEVSLASAEIRIEGPSTDLTLYAERYADSRLAQAILAGIDDLMGEAVVDSSLDTASGR